MQRSTTSTPAGIVVRDGSRDGSAPSVREPDACPVCSARLPSTRAHFCSAVCRQRAYRFRQAVTARPTGQIPDAPRAQRQRPADLKALTIYECPSCQERFLGQQRCSDCNRFCRSLGLGGACPECDHPIVLAELLGQEVTS